MRLNQKGRIILKRTMIWVIGVMFCVMFSGFAMAEDITIVGTGSGAAILKAVGDSFCQKVDGVTVNVPKSIGSGGGIKAVGTDQEVIGRVARQIKDKEKHYGLTYTPIVKMPIAFFVNKGVGIKGLSAQQVCGIYSGKIKNWNEVGGKDAKIRVIRREKGDSSLSVLLKSFPGFKDITITDRSKTTLSDPETCELCEKKAYTIAFGPYANARTRSVDILEINGKKATDADYASVGILALVFKEENKKGVIDEFVAFATSSAAHDAIQRAGGVPL